MTDCEGSLGTVDSGCLSSLETAAAPASLNPRMTCFHSGVSVKQILLHAH